ncbi:MAG: hypothetical protein JNL18_05015 [Planctomycetaceae bacterium]|nr:hypothetical protein [Planctomycetaceae bacterium]
MIDDAIQFAVDFGSIVWRGLAKLLGLRRDEKPSSLAMGLSVIAAIIVLGVLAGIVAIAIRWLFTA